MAGYAVIDLEMCYVTQSMKKKYGYSSEIIQIGAVLMDEAYEIKDTFSCYVKPDFSKLDHFIRDLTGISWADLKDAPELQEALQRFYAWLPEGPVTAVAWSGTDETQLKREMMQKGLDIDELNDRIPEWFDSQKLFAEKMKLKRSYSLQEALVAADIRTEGRAHDGAADAYNTALLFRKLRTEEEIRLNPYYEDAHKEDDGGTLQFSLGDLLKGLKADLKKTGD